LRLYDDIRIFLFSTFPSYTADRIRSAGERIPAVACQPQIYGAFSRILRRGEYW